MKDEFEVYSKAYCSISPGPNKNKAETAPMSLSRKQPETAPDTAGSTTAYGVDAHVVDYILGITFEIWEQRQVESILQYYAEDVDVFSLDGLSHGASTMVDSTHATLDAFPDRLLLGDEVIWSGSTRCGFSSHRLISPMTNLGPTLFGPATGRHIQAMNIADCEINDGQITREWLVRDNLAVVRQLGFDTMAAARGMADRFETEHKSWLEAEFTRASAGPVGVKTVNTPSDVNDPESFARLILESCWTSGGSDVLETAYAPYCVMKRAPRRIFSGRDNVLRHYADWRNAFPDARLSVDHVCRQRADEAVSNLAVRWSVAGFHQGGFAGGDATGRPVYVLGVTHWRIVNGRIVAEWTVFDELAMLAQTMDVEVND
jgi:predicted ester cyclase